MGAETYKVIKSLAIPSKPTEKTFQEIVQLLKEHQTPNPNKIAERFKFNMRDRKDGESLSVYLAELRRLTDHCDYQDQLEDMLRDLLVCGIKHERIQQHLLSEGDSLTLQRALDIAHSMESAIHQASMMKSTYSNNSERLEDICKVNYSQNLKCFRYHGKHKANDCPFKSKECYVCRKKGHIGKVCRSKSFKNKRETNLVEKEEKTSSDEDSADEIFNIYKLATEEKQEPYKLNVRINSNDVIMEIDTGASISIINYDTYSKLVKKSKSSLMKSNVMLRTYSGSILKARGKFEEVFEYEGQKLKHQFVVVDRARPNLLGRDILNFIVIDWSQFKRAMQVNNVNEVLNNLCEEYFEVFSPGLGTMKGVEVWLNVDKGAKPVFYKARPVPYSIKEKTELELERLVSENIFQPVEYLEWASPIVPVKKPDGSIRICGDYKVSVNKVSKCDKYPVPKTEDLLATLNGGKRFSKLDLSQAY